MPIGLFIGLRVAPPRPDPPTPSYSELVTIVLAAVTVVLAVLAIIVAILAIWGYQNIRAEASNLAARAVDKSVDEAIKKHLKEDSIRDRIEKELKRTVDAMLYSVAYTPPEAAAGQEQEGTVAEEYPKEPEGPHADAG